MARHCGKCGGRGHYKSTCTKKSRKGKKGAIRRYATGSVTRSQRGHSFIGSSGAWVVLYHGGRTGDTQHDKTWAVKLQKKGSGWSVVTRHGRRTGQKNETVRKPTSKEAAIREANRLIRSKLAKGYE